MPFYTDRLLPHLVHWTLRSGAFRKLETTVLLTQDEVLEALGKAQDVGYVAPAAGVHA